MLDQNTLLRNRYRVLVEKATHDPVVSYEAYDSQSSALVRLWAWPSSDDPATLERTLAPFFSDSGLIRPVLLDSFTTDNVAVAVVDTRQDETSVARFADFVRSEGRTRAMQPPPIMPDATLPPTALPVGASLLDAELEPTATTGEPEGRPLPAWEPPTEGATPPPPPPGRRRWVYMLGGAGFVACCLVPLCCYLLSSAFAPQLEELMDEIEAQLTPTVAGGLPPDADGEVISIFDLQVGDCLDEPEGVLTTLGSVTRVSCDAPHTYEVFGALDYDAGDGEFPGEDVMSDYAQERCLSEFESYVGLDNQLSVLYFSTLYPSADSWEEQGDRVVNCILYEEGTVLEESMRGAAR